MVKNFPVTLWIFTEEPRVVVAHHQSPRLHFHCCVVTVESGVSASERVKEINQTIPVARTMIRAEL